MRESERGSERGVQQRRGSNTARQVLTSFNFCKWAALQSGSQRIHLEKLQCQVFGSVALLRPPEAPTGFHVV